MISCPYYMLSSKKYALTRLCAGFSDRIFLNELEVDFVQTERYRCLYTFRFKCCSRCRISISATKINLLLSFRLLTHCRAFSASVF